MAIRKKKNLDRCVGFYEDVMIKINMKSPYQILVPINLNLELKKKKLKIILIWIEPITN